ncbi:MAG: 3-oxoacyl-ACP reductase FabG [Acidobacteria bacterium]|nr:3-oxoacyl-ACP reductase FabG [Acidobacteriota bacterium]MCW5969236.1 3-oxoacyl-ACP reductase FabG [Blastocatellales bacterium]
MSKALEGRAALVTGGSRGIGAAIAMRLAADGANVAITYTSSPEKAAEVVRAIEAAGGRATAIRADGGDAEAVRSAVAETARIFGRLDILVNNAGIAMVGSPEEFRIEDFDRMVAVNVRAVFVAAQEAVRHLGEGGRIITIGSVNADRIHFPGGSVYAMTKAAVAGLTRGLARDLGPRAITVNNIQPGPVETDMNPASGPFAEEMKRHLALGRFGRSEEIAAFVSYLAGPESAFITGASFNIDGGYVM